MIRTSGPRAGWAGGDGVAVRPHDLPLLGSIYPDPVTPLLPSPNVIRQEEATVKQEELERAEATVKQEGLERAVASILLDCARLREAKGSPSDLLLPLLNERERLEGLGKVAGVLLASATSDSSVHALNAAERKANAQLATSALRASSVAQALLGANLAATGEEERARQELEVAVAALAIVPTEAVQRLDSLNLLAQLCISCNQYQKAHDARRCTQAPFCPTAHPLHLPSTSLPPPLPPPPHPIPPTTTPTPRRLHCLRQHVTSPPRQSVCVLTSVTRDA